MYYYLHKFKRLTKLQRMEAVLKFFALVTNLKIKCISSIELLICF